MHSGIEAHVKFSGIWFFRLNAILLAPRQIVLDRILKRSFKFLYALTLKRDNVSCVDHAAREDMLIIVKFNEARRTAANLGKNVDPCP